MIFFFRGPEALFPLPFFFDHFHGCVVHEPVVGQLFLSLSEIREQFADYLIQT